MKTARKRKTLVSHAAAATMLGIPKPMVAELVCRLKLRPKPIAHLARAKGLDESDLTRIRAWLDLASEPGPACRCNP